MARSKATASMTPQGKPGVKSAIKAKAPLTGGVMSAPPREELQGSSSGPKPYLVYRPKARKDYKPSGNPRIGTPAYDKKKQEQAKKLEEEMKKIEENPGRPKREVRKPQL